MTTIAYCFDRLCDRELLAEVKRLALSERQATAHLVASLAEFDARRLYLGEGCSSLFTYCRDVLHLSEHAAYNRIEAARVARRFPLILERLADGSVHLTAIRLLDRHLTSENYREVLDAARHKSKLEVLQLIARIDPKPDVAASVHKLAAPATATSVIDTTTAAADSEATELKLTTVNVASAPPQRLSEITPLAPERFKVQFTVSKETHDKLRRAQDLMRHRIPDGDPAAIFDRALTVLLAELERTKLAAAKRPRGGLVAQQRESFGSQGKSSFNSGYGWPVGTREV